MSVTGRLLNVVTRIPRAPARQLLIHYLVVATIGVTLVFAVPELTQSVMGTPFGGSVRATSLADVSSSVAPAGGLPLMLLLLVAMLGTLLLSVPVSWAYMAVRERQGFDQSVVQTIVILPSVVAAIMMVVQHSLALAFALAGVAAAVRFRNTLRDVADATYVFMALGIGIAAGTGSLAAAAVMSLVFTLVSVALWRCEFGQCPTTIATAIARPGVATVPVVRSGMLLVRVSEAEQARPAIEAVLDSRAKKWKLKGIEQAEDGSLVRYAVRAKKSVAPATIVEEVVASGGSSIGEASFEALPVKT